MVKKVAKKTEGVDVTLEEAVEILWKLKAKRDAIEDEYKKWDKYLKSNMGVGDTVTGETVAVELLQTEKLEVAVEALKNAFPDTFMDCLSVTMSKAEAKYGRESLEKIGAKVPYQKKFNWLPREV